MLTGFDYHRPSTEQELQSLLMELDDVTLLAGGTDVLVQMRSGRLRPRHLVDVSGVSPLRGMEGSVEDGLDIGAVASVRDVVRHPYVTEHLAAVAEGGREVGSVQIQNRATLVGNICNASPAADTAPGLLVFDAVVRVAGPTEERSVPLRRFLRGPGATDLRPGEWVRAITIPRPEPSGSCYLKLGRTRGVDLAIVGVACRVSSTDAWIAIAAASPIPLCVDLAGIQDLEATDLQAASVAAIRAVLQPIDDVRASAAYRQEMAIALARRAWHLARRRFAETVAA
jgi:CO/xanthine dehydrogenase FAD-binding subunit